MSPPAPSFPGIAARPALFAADGMRAVVLTPVDAPVLQAFFDANPAYFLACTDEPAGPGEALEVIGGGLPPGWPFTHKWVMAFVDTDGGVAGMANVVSDLVAPAVWHIGLFIVATDRFGTGLAVALHAALERWAIAGGAQWMRLGVVEGNARAERFWARRGYGELRRREGIAMGRRVNVVRVMMKPLAGGTRDAYLELVARDRHDA